MTPKLAKGTKVFESKEEMRQIALRWPAEEFDRLAAQAYNAKLTFAEYCRVLIRRGEQNAAEKAG